MVALTALLSFSAWAAQHGKTYNTPEETTFRRAIFAANVAKIQKHNAEKHSWTMGINEFADLTAAEFKAARTSTVLRQARTKVNASLLTMAPKADIDWQAEGAVQVVKNQGQCGSCWAFSAIGSMESAVYIAKGGVVPNLSEQQVNDCSWSYGNQGCNGGLMDLAFQYIIANGGVDSTANYPYTASDGTCDTSAASAASISNYADVPANSDTALMNALAIGPVSVAIQADEDSFQFYTGGVMNEACGTALNHGVLAVGYGTDAASGLDYYKVKNSWGTAWGMAGYILLAKGGAMPPQGQCGILMDSSYPIV